jgi:hypothetical protein
MNAFALIERRIDNLRVLFDDEIPNECKCPFTGKLMVEPMMAYDNITYEKVEIDRWILLHSSTLKSPVTGEHMFRQLIPNRAIEWIANTYRENHQILLETPTPCESTTLTQEALLSRLTYSCRWYTKYKFTEFDSDVMARSFELEVPYSWWPIPQDEQQFIRSAWAACPAWRKWIYETFAIALNESTSTIKDSANAFYLNSILTNIHDTKTDQIFKALTACVNMNGKNLSNLTKYKLKNYNQYLEFWGEKPPPPPVLRRSEPDTYYDDMSTPQRDYGRHRY